MKARAILALVLAPFLFGCSDMKAIDFKDRQPRLILEDYFSGDIRAWGIFEDRFGNLRRQFTVDITGTWDGRLLRLDERFLFDDGEQDRRIWRITKTGNHTYEGVADDVVGTARGEAYGNALNWQYDLDLKVGDSTVRVHFNDWMFLQSPGVLVNRAQVSKFGFNLGEVTLFFARADMADEIFAGLSLARRPILAASQAAVQ